MFVAILKQDRKSWLLEASDGRRFVISGKKDVTVCPEGSQTPLLTARGVSYKAARRLLEEELAKEGGRLAQGKVSLPGGLTRPGKATSHGEGTVGVYFAHLPFRGIVPVPTSLFRGAGLDPSEILPS